MEAGRPRNPWIDRFRGVCHVLMMINHMPGNPLKLWELYPLGFVPVAETFVFLAGMTTGLAYPGVRRKRGPAVMRHHILRRARRVYGTHLLMYALMWLALLLFPVLQVRWAEHGVPARPGAATLLLGALLLDQPSFLDVLPMYCVFVAVATPAIEGLERGLLPVLAGLSALVWAQNLWTRGWLVHVLPQVNPGFFDVAAWQLLFFSGLFVTWSGWGRRLSSRPVALAALAALLAFQVARLFSDDVLAWHWPWMERSQLEPLRLALFYALVAFTAWAIRGRDGRWMDPLAYLGRNSLEVFAFSVVVTYTAYLFEPQWRRLPGWGQVMCDLAAVGTLFLPAWVMEKSRARTRTSPST